MATSMGLVTPLDAAREYVRRGWSVVPIPRGKKAPILEGWPQLRLKEEELSRYFSETTNIGLLLGEPSGGLVDVDLDAPEAIAVADFFLPKTWRVHGRPTKRRSHRWYQVSASLGYVKLVDPILQKSDPRKSTIVEIRQGGHLTVVPPSAHESGELCGWDDEGEPAEADAGDLCRRVHIVATATLLARYWPAEGRRHDAALALAGMLLRAGWNEEQASQFVGAVAAAAGDEEQRQRVRDVVSTANRLIAGRSATGAPTLAQIIGDVVAERAREWLGIAVVWPDPSPLGDEMPPVQTFSLELLPPSLRALVEDVSDRMQTPLDYAAAAAIVGLAGCVNRRAVILPKAQDVTWEVVLNLWGAIIGPPGVMKSPVLRAITLPLAHIEELWHAEYSEESSEYETAREQAELRHQAWREDCKRAFKTNKPTPIVPDCTISAPAQRRLVLTDATFEKLHEILCENPAGVLFIRDELTGWLSQLDKQGREGERGFFLQAWNGDAGFTVDRIGRGSIRVPAVCVSLLGNIQPSRLRAYLSAVLEGGPSDDGLFQRFQILIWPDPPRTWTLVDRLPDDDALIAAEKMYSALANRLSDDPIQIRFGPDAQKLFNQWWTELENKLRSDSGLSPSLVAHFAKYRSLMPTLAALFELADLAAAGDLSREVLVSLDHTRQAAAFCDYLQSHARRVYASVINPERRAAHELARHIMHKDVPESFTPRNIYLKGWSGLDTSERVRAGLSLLEDAGWVRRKDFIPSPTGGRPSEDWIVNPRVYHHDTK
jgi:Protein of unknown function (DUF3987)/Bifunctional DNA primase/polymerase, N-terminal